MIRSRFWRHLLRRFLYGRSVIRPLPDTTPAQYRARLLALRGAVTDRPQTGLS
jgi:hypothetical protein